MKSDQQFLNTGIILLVLSWNLLIREFLALSSVVSLISNSSTKAQINRGGDLIDGIDPSTRLIHVFIISRGMKGKTALSRCEIRKKLDAQKCAKIYALFALFSFYRFVIEILFVVLVYFPFSILF